ncbi:MAG: prolyl-tRNA synthetase associated domain-containing protein [Bauldia sp.]|nr:prolyl-tRNA synthetase associated domain-containing protein [Bauldia sp.]
MSHLFARPCATNPAVRPGNEENGPVPASTDDLMASLGRLGIATTTVSHPPLFTVEESRALRGTIPGAHTKNLFLKDKKDAIFLVTALEDAEIDLKHLHHEIGASGRLSFGRPELLAERLGVVPGAVTPFGVINDVPPTVTVILDAALAAHATINCHPLVNTATTTIASADLIAFIRATGHEPRILPLDRAEGRNRL